MAHFKDHLWMRSNWACSIGIVIHLTLACYHQGYSTVDLVGDNTDENDPSNEPVIVIQNPIGTPWYSSALIIVNAGLGAGLLAFPQAYDLAGGIPIALIIQFILALIALGSLMILAHCSDQTNTGTYQDVVDKCAGTKINILCSLIIAIYTFGCCITFLIIIGDQWDKVFDYAISDPILRSRWFLDRKFIITITSIPIILPLCYPKRIDFLRYASAIGVIGVLYIAVLIVVEYFTDLPPPGPIKVKPDHWTDVFNVLPVICFGYQCHVSAVPVYSCMRGRPNLRLFLVCASVAILLCFISYTSTGVFGYLTFGAHVSSDILIDYPAKPEVMVGLALLAIKTYTTYPILHFCGRSALETCLVQTFHWSDDFRHQIDLKWRYGCSTIWFAISLLLALFVPNIGIVIGLLGGLAGLFIFVFPGLCLMNLVLYENPTILDNQAKLILSLAIAYILFGTFVFGLTTTQSIMNMVPGRTKSGFEMPTSFDKILKLFSAKHIL